MHHDFDPTLTFDSAADLRLYRLRKLDFLYRLKPRRPTPKPRRLRAISLSQVFNV